MFPSRRFPPSPSDTPGSCSAAGSDTPAYPRRTSALSYQNSATRDARDPSYSRSSRNLVVVIPPSDLPLDHGHLGSVLSMGPRHRLSQGILMPLFPSMFGQLNAIAREYNFPSTIGLCLFLHISENGMTMTPRISDDSWQYLFGHLFDARASSGGRQFPIGGSIEFDIDLNKARWFDSWVSGTLRDSGLAHPPLGTSSEARWRAESQTIDSDGHPVEDRGNVSGSHTLVTNSRPETLRHLPKKLSLVDRLESHGVHVSLKTRDPDFRESSPTHGTYASSPILSSVLPRAAESDLKHRINSWRASTALYPTSMAETYQPAPVAVDEYALAHNFRRTIDECLWSVTSEGPRTPIAEPLNAPSHASSVHLDRRANGIAPVTPTTMTSWDPVDDDLHSVLSTATWLPPPDMGERAIEDATAPRPRAVWGNSFGWRTALTWKQVYPYSYIGTKSAIRVQLQDSGGFAPQYPNLEIYPFVGSRSPLNAPKDMSRSVWGSSFGWQRSVTWRNVYPFSKVQSVGPTQLRGTAGLEAKYPNLCIYPAVYPHFEIYPACAIEGDVVQPVSMTLNESSRFSARYPSLVIYSAVYPHFDIYPPVVEGMRTNESDQADINIHLLGGASVMYPNLVIYSAVYPHFDLYPEVMQINEPESSVAIWSRSFGLLPAKAAGSLITKPHIDDQSQFISKSGSEDAVIVDNVARKRAIWGISFGWKNATTWRAVWPNTYARTDRHVSLMSKHMEQRNDSSNLAIRPYAYPHFDIYPQPTQAIHLTVDLILHYPNLVIYPVVYPHFDIYPAFLTSFVAVERGEGESNLRRRRMEMWRAKTAAQVGLSELVCNNHIWEVDEPLRLDLADYTWSQTSAGPGTSPLELFDILSISESVHVDRRIQGSVIRTPSTATTWGPQDDEWYSEIESIERLPSPDLGQRFLDDVEDIEFTHRPRHMVLDQSVSGYPHLVIYPPAYPHFELYPVRGCVPKVAGARADLNVYPSLDSYPVVYPHFNVYPAIKSQIEMPSKIVLDVGQEHAEVGLASSNSNFDILYPFIIPYPCTSVEITPPSGPEQLLAFPSMECKQISVRLPVRYPVFELYPAAYPWSLEFIYPAFSIDDIDDCSVVLKPRYPCIWIYTPVYPFVEPYPGASGSLQIPGTVDKYEYESVKACLASLEPINPESTTDAYPYFDIYSAAPMPAAQQVSVEQDAYICANLTTWPHMMTRRQRKTHHELHDLVFRSLGKQPARVSKTHLQLHTEVVQDGIVWTPSGYKQDISSFITSKRGDVVPKLEPRRPFESDSTRPPRSRSGITTASSPDKFVFSLGQPPVLPALSPLRPRTPAQPSPPVSETPTPRGSPTSTHLRTRSARLTQAVKAIMPGGHRRNVSAAPASPPPKDHKEHAKSPTRLLSSVDQRSAAVTSNTPEFLTRSLRNRTTKESLVMQRAKAYEKVNLANDSSGTVKGTHSPFVLPPLPPLAPMTGVAEVIEKSKGAFS